MKKACPNGRGLKIKFMRRVHTLDTGLSPSPRYANIWTRKSGEKPTPKFPASLRSSRTLPPKSAKQPMIWTARCPDNTEANRHKSRPLAIHRELILTLFSWHESTPDCRIVEQNRSA